MDIKFGTWNVRSLNKAGSLTAAARELARRKLDLVGVKYGKGKEYYQLGTGFFVHYRIVLAGKRAEILSDRMTYIVLRGR
jgi:hypothetical protein